MTPFTEEGLSRVADSYSPDDRAEDDSDGDHRESLRWSTCDSPYHVTAEIGVPPLVDSHEMFQLWKEWGEDEAPFARDKDDVRKLCKQALRELDAEGLFGTSRAKMTLLIEDRDGMETAEEIRLIIAELNPPEALDRYDHFRAALERVWAQKT